MWVEVRMLSEKVSSCPTCYFEWSNPHKFMFM